MYRDFTLSVLYSFLASSLFVAGLGFAEELTLVEEKTWPIVSQSIPLEIVNLRGNIKVTQNNEDRVFAKLIKRGVLSEKQNVFQVQTVLNSQQLKWSQEAGQTRLSLTYSDGQDVQARLRFREPDYRADLEVSVPANLQVRIVGKKSAVSLVGIRLTSADVRVDEGSIQLRRLTASTISIGIKSGDLAMDEVSSLVDASVIRGETVVNDCGGAELKITQNSGKMALNRLAFSKTLLKSKEVELRLNNTRGLLSVVAQGGAFFAEGLQGALSLASDYMNVEVAWNSWSPFQESSVESRYGKIVLKLPKNFQGELNVKSVKGKIESGDIALTQNRFLEFSEHQSSIHEFQGFVRHRLGHLIVRSVTGNVILSKNSS